MNALFTPRPGATGWLLALGAAVLFVLLFAFLNTLPGRNKRHLILAVTFLAGLFYFLEFMLPAGFMVRGGEPGTQDNFLTQAESPLTDFVLVIGVLALVLSSLNLIQYNGRALFRMQSGWHNSLIFFVGMIGMLVVGIQHNNLPDNTTWNNLYNFFFRGLYTSLASSTFALLAFFIATAAFRAFRISSAESTLMMVTAFIVMLGNVGSELVTGWIPPESPLALFRLDNLTLWIMTTVNMSAQRALLFGIAVGELAIALRIWLSLERGHFFDQEV